MIALRRFWNNEQGVTMIEYSLIAGLVSVIAIASLTAVGQSVLTIMTNVSTALGGAA